MPLAPLSPGHQRPPFKARPLNKRVMESAGDLGVPRIARAMPTVVNEFKFSTPRGRAAPAKSEEIEVPVFSSFASKPLRRSASFTPRASPAASPARERPTAAEKSEEVPVYSSFARASVRRSTSFTPRPATAPSASKPAAAKPAAAKLGSVSASAKPRIGLLGLTEVLSRP